MTALYDRFHALLSRAGLADLLVASGDVGTLQPMESGGELIVNAALVVDGWDYGLCIVDGELLMIGGSADYPVMNDHGLSSEFVGAVCGVDTGGHYLGSAATRLQWAENYLADPEMAEYRDDQSAADFLTDMENQCVEFVTLNGYVHAFQY